MKSRLVGKLFLLMILTAIVFTFTSCSIINIIDTGTVTITVNEYYVMGKIPLTSTYYIYIDNIYKGMIIDFEPLTLEDITVGMHTFEASNYLLGEDSVNLKGDEMILKKGKIEIIPPSCYGTINKTINTGVNYVTIPVYCGGAIL